MDWKPNPEVLNKNKIIKEPNGFTLVELMVVIVIVGILAAVAIPKFLDASNKAKASEFPTQLTAIYTGEMAYNAENGSYVAGLANLVSTAGVDITTSSKWFSYLVTSASPNTSFTGYATVTTPFGVTASGNSASVDQTNAKAANASLTRYVPTWK